MTERAVNSLKNMRKQPFFIFNKKHRKEYNLDKIIFERRARACIVR